jgi:formate dehydrogenase
LPEWLQRIQNWRGYIPADEISALIEENFEDLNAPSQSCETADQDTFSVPEVRVCFGRRCILAGAVLFCEAIAASQDGRRIIRETCIGRCWMAPVATIGDDVISGAHEHGATENSSCGAATAGSSRESLTAFTDGGGYGVLKSCLTKRRSVESVVSALSSLPLAEFEGAKDAIGVRMRELRVNGGATKLLLMIDERRPGVMSQAYLIERHTHSILEGLLIAAWAAGAEEVLVHSDRKYSSLRRCLEQGLDALSESGFDRHVTFAFSEFSPEKHADDDSLLRSLRCNNAHTADREVQGLNPSAPASVLIVRAELLRWIPEILAKGADSFCAHGGKSRGAPVLYSVAGRVGSPGVYKAPAGQTIDELVAMAGGLEGGYDFDSFVAGDWSNPALPAHLGNVTIDCEPEGPAHPGRGVPVVVISRQDHAARLCAFRSDLAFSDRDSRRPGRQRHVAESEHSVVPNDSCS